MRQQLQALGINLRNNNRGSIKTQCPKCSAERKHKHDTCLSVDIEQGIWNCHNCGWSGSIKTHKEYTRPVQTELKKLSDNVIDWFNTRGISNQTLLRYRVSESKEYMNGEESLCINFNYFYNGKLVNVKYRDSKKGFKLVSGAMLSLYGLDVAMDSCDDELVITEGEIDTLSFYEAGIKHAVSVPNGASKGSQKLEWLEELYGIFENRRVYLATDTDESGLSLRNELARRLGKQNCLIVSFPEGCKDANEVLLKYGSEAVKQCYDQASPYPVEGIEDASSVDIMALYDTGTPKGFDIGMDFLWHTGQVSLVTGIPGHGKSTFLKNVMSKLAKLHDWKFFIYSAEEASTEFALADLISIETGKAFFDTTNGARVTKKEVETLTPYLTDHFKYYKLSENDLTIHGIITKAIEMVKRYGINGFVIDNMSTVERGMPKAGDNRHHSIGDMMNDIVKFSRNYGVHVFLVAHPKKMSKLKSGIYDIPTGYDVGDSSYYYNLPDNGFTVYRNIETKQTEVHRWKVRFKYTGQMGVDYFKFDIQSGRYSLTQKLNDGTDSTRFVGQPTRDEVTRFISAGAI